MHKIKRRILRRMTSFGRTKVKKTSKSIQVYRIRESPFSKGLQGYTRVSLAIKKIPDDEVRQGINTENTGFHALVCMSSDTKVTQIKDE